MNCAHCGTQMRPGAKFCPRCGQLPVSAVIKTCPYCGHNQRAEARFCGLCGKDLAVLVSCSACGTMLRTGAKICHRCGQPVQMAVCPVCQVPNRLGSAFCAKCGTPLPRKRVDRTYPTGKVPPNTVLNNRYIVLRTLAEGGMSAVYIVADPKTPGRKWVAKEMSYKPLEGLEPAKRAETLKYLREGFEREFQILRDARHPNLPAALDFFEEMGRAYIVLEFVEGRTLQQVLSDLTSGSFLPRERVLTWAAQLCDVLDYLHSQCPPIIYRDLKPSNVMIVAGSDTVKLIDFGIARFFKPGVHFDTMRFGTYGYLAPEIATNREQTSPVTDVYALGALLHQLLTNRDPTLQPFLYPPISVLRAGVPPQLEVAVMAAVSNKPERRPQSALALFKLMFGQDAGLPKRPPITSTQPAVELSVNPQRLDFGKIKSGTRSSEITLQITAQNGVEVEFAASEKWLQVIPNRLTGCGGAQVVRVWIEGLEASQAGKPNQWIQALPVWLRNWLGGALPAPAEEKAQANLTIRQKSGPEIVVIVEVLIEPTRV